MITYCVSQTITLRTANQVSTFRAAQNPRAPTPEEIYIAAQNELNLLKLAASQGQESTTLHVLDPDELASLTPFPPRLGTPQSGNSQSPDLADQLRTIRKRHGQRHHYRFLIINGFGSNLGDTLIGLTAFRHMLRVCESILPSFTFDVLLGWHSSDALDTMYAQTQGIGECFHRGMTLAELQSYQGYIDTSDLILLEDYGRVPMVDWYLNLLGIDSQTIAETEKRNFWRLSTIPQAHYQALLAEQPGPIIVFNPRASAPLRCMPLSSQSKATLAILAQWPTATVVSLAPPAVTHAQVLDYSVQIPDIEHLAALVALADAVLGVDTFTTHLADAVNTPCLTLFTSFRPEIYPYYPLNGGVLLPGAKHLPAWGHPKTSTKDWEAMQSRYETAWTELDWPAACSQLAALLAMKALRTNERPAPQTDLRSCMSQIIRRGAGDEELPWVAHTMQRDVLADQLETAIRQIATQHVVRGDTVVHIGPGMGRLALHLARQVGVEGLLQLFEPRSELHLLLCTNLVARDLWQVQTHCVLPERIDGECKPTPRLNIKDNFSPRQFSNSHRRITGVRWPLDSLQLSECRLLILCSPFVYLPILDGARETIRHCRPLILIGLLGQADTLPYAEYFKGLPYSLQFKLINGIAKDFDKPPQGLLIALPLVAPQET